MGFPPHHLHYAILGPGLSGKTTLAKQLSRNYWKSHGIKSLVLDPNKEDWGPQAWMTDDQDKFWDMVWNRETGCALFCDEGNETISRNSDKTPLFTRVRHRDHRMHIIGHSGGAMLPIQRDQIHTLFLFRQSKSGAELWAEKFTDERIMESMNLNQYEFLFCQLYKTPKKLRLKI